MQVEGGAVVDWQEVEEFRSAAFKNAGVLSDSDENEIRTFLLRVRQRSRGIISRDVGSLQTRHDPFFRWRVDSSASQSEGDRSQRQERLGDQFLSSDE